MNDGAIWVIGSANVDLVMKMPHLPRVGESVGGAEFSQAHGGKGANSAVGAARAGGSVVFVGAVGEDSSGAALLESLRTEGVDLRFVQRVAGVPSGHALIMIGEAGQNYLSVAPGANHRLEPGHLEVLGPEWSKAKRVLLQNEVRPETNRRALELARQHGVPVQWNLAPYSDLPGEWLGLVDLLILNESEALELGARAGVRGDSFDLLAGALRRLGPRGVLVTLGAEGVVVSTPEWSGRVEAFPVAAVDTTGAGDIFCGALATALVEGRPMEEAVRFGCAAGAISVTRLGAQPSAPGRPEIESLLTSKHHAP